MTILTVCPVWSPSTSVAVEVVPGKSLRSVLADHFDIVGDELVGVWEDGRTAELDLPAAEGGVSGQLAISLRNITYPMALFISALHQDARGRQAGTARMGTQDPAPNASPGWSFMSEMERTVAEGVKAAGLSPNPDECCQDQIIRSFPELPPGYEKSPYRVLMSYACILESEGDLAPIAEVGARAEHAAGELQRRLQIQRPDELDFRLHVFAEHLNSKRLLDALLPGGPQPRTDMPARVHGPWRRVLVTLYRDESHRLEQMANLARLMSIERLDPQFREEFQAVLGRLDMASRGHTRWMDYQEQISIVPSEEHLRARAEKILLDRLEGEFFDKDHAGEPNGLSMSEHGMDILRRCGLFDRLYDNDGLEIGDHAWNIASKILRNKAILELGGWMDDTESVDEKLLEKWAAGLKEATDENPLPMFTQQELGRIIRTVCFGMACSLRSELERLLAERTFPPQGEATVKFHQMLAILRFLHHQLGGLQSHADSDMMKWVEQQRNILNAALSAQRAKAIEQIHSRFNWIRKLLMRIGIGRSTTKRQVVNHIDELVRLWVKFALMDYVIAVAGTPEHQYGLDFADILIDQFAKFAEGVSTYKTGLIAAAAKRDTFDGIGAVRSLPEQELITTEPQLEQMVGNMDLSGPFRSALRDGENLKDLFSLSPEVLLNDVLSATESELIRGVSAIVQATELLSVDELMPKALRILFQNSLVSQSGQSGVAGHLDDRTTLVVAMSPSLLLQLGIGPDLGHLVDPQIKLERAKTNFSTSIRTWLNELGISSSAEITILTSPFIRGILLIRLLHALAPGELLP